MTEAGSRKFEPEPESHATYRASVREWYDNNATRRRDNDPWAVNVHTNITDSQTHFDKCREWQRRLHSAGYTGIAWPAEYGGGGGEAWMTRIEREVSRDYEETSGFPGATTAMLGPALLRHGSEQQKHDYLPKLLAAELTFCQLFSEPDAGSDLASLASRAVREGDDFIISGQKVWNSSAQHCDWAFLLVRTDPDQPKHRGITFLLLDMATPGIEVRPLVQINRAAHFNEVFLSDVRVPVANVVGEINGGWGPARTVLANESAFIGRTKAPTSDNLYALARRYDRIGDASVRQELMRFAIRERVAGWMAEQIQQAIRGGEVPPMDPGLIKLMAAVNKVCSGNLAMKITGAHGLIGDRPETYWSQIELLGRFVISIGGGTNEVLRNNLGERALGLPREPGFAKDQPWRQGSSVCEPG